MPHGRRVAVTHTSTTRSTKPQDQFCQNIWEGLSEVNPDSSKIPEPDQKVTVERFESLNKDKQQLHQITKVPFRSETAISHHPSENT